ncbi:MAG TPA: HAD-IA family hydrolase [Burkholderiales bacterium]|nr:HAD-IA family hydrolase [Burkholderiales bacterium]
MPSRATAETASKRKRFELLVFDWDGTLTDSSDLIVASMQVACADLGLPVPDPRQVRHIIGLGFNEAIAYLLPELPASDYPQLVERYRHHFLSRGAPIPMFPGAIETIQQLHESGFLLAVATGKSRRGLNRDFQETGLGQYFHASRCADECFSKPHPGMLFELVEELHVDVGKTLMIGDTTHDMQMAQSAGVASLAVSYGAHPREKLLALSPLACVNDTLELQQWLNTYA